MSIKNNKWSPGKGDKPRPANRANWEKGFDGINWGADGRPGGKLETEDDIPPPEGSQSHRNAPNLKDVAGMGGIYTKPLKWLKSQINRGLQVHPHLTPEEVKAIIEDTEYWEHRKDAQYYSAVKNIISTLKDCKSIIDVGSGATLFLNEIDIPDKTIVDRYRFDIYDKLDSLSIRIGDFSVMPFHRKYDIVLCLEVLEHIKNEERHDFINKLFDIANKHVIISIPYQWVTNDEHNGLDILTLIDWVGKSRRHRLEDESYTITEDKKYLIASYYEPKSAHLI